MDFNGARTASGASVARCVISADLSWFVLMHRFPCAQGPAPRAGSTNGEKKWTKGAPNTKVVQMPGVGKGNNPNSHKRQKLENEQERDPQLPTSVPMPSAVEDITDAGMRALWEQSAAMDGEPAPFVEPVD